MPNEKYAELEFPLSGIDVTAEFQEQKPGTTPEAINVRGFDPIARRARGGSRPGIAHFAPNAVPANTSLDMIIQHLAVIVDPHATALPQNFVTPQNDWPEDPLNPGTFVPPGGWGVQDNPDVIQPPKPSTLMTINVTLSGTIGGHSLTEVHILLINTADDRTGAAAYTFSNLADTGDQGVQCTAGIGTWYAIEGFLNGVSQGPGFVDSDYVINVPWVSGGTASVEFVMTS